jgi:hypothetical protein
MIASGECRWTKSSARRSISLMQIFASGCLLCKFDHSNNDLDSTGGKPGGSCTAALFLKAFVEGIDSKDGKEPSLQWAHIDIAGTMEVGII